MYKTIDDALDFVKTLAPKVEGSQADIGLAVPFTAIFSIANFVQMLPIRIGAQNMSDQEEGALTGEISGRMLKNAGAQFVILGHSERRKIFSESSEFVNRKVKRALLDGLDVILCIGESLEEREKGLTEAVLEKQLNESLEGISSQELQKITLAYEPIWAIGTGRVAQPEDAQKTHAFCRSVIQAKILYGGSVKPQNASSLLAMPDIDGLLVGGASLEADSFSQIVNSYKESI